MSNFCFMLFILKGLKKSNYNADLVLQESGVSIGSNFTQVEGRVLPTPRVWLTLLLLQVNTDRVTPFES